MRRGPALRSRAYDRDGGLRERLDRLEDDVASFLEGGPLSPPPPTRAARLSRNLLVAGVALIVVAVVLAVV